MAKKLIEDQSWVDYQAFDLARYVQDGFGVVRNAVAPILVARLAAAVERVQAAVPILPPNLRERLTLERDLSADRRGGIPSSAVGDAVFLLGDPVAFDDEFWSLLDNQGVIEPIAAALDTEAIEAHFMNVTIKHSHWGRALGWHRDFPNAYACPAGSSFLRAMVCLDGMDDASGATTFVPGSHRISDKEAHELFEAGKRETPASGEVVSVCCGPGDLVLIHPKVLHGGSQNLSNRPRRNIVLQVGDAHAPLLSVPTLEGVSGYRLSVSHAGTASK